MDSRAASFRGEADALVCTAYVSETASITFTHVSAPAARSDASGRLRLCADPTVPRDARPGARPAGVASWRPSGKCAVAGEVQWSRRAYDRRTAHHTPNKMAKIRVPLLFFHFLRDHEISDQ